jgi:plastocyanin
MRKSSITVLLFMSILTTGLASTALPRMAKNRPARATSTVQAKSTVKISSFKFEPKVLTIAPGTIVEWVNDGGRHSVVADNGSFKSDVLKQGDKFEHKFDKAGTYAYHCEFHGEKGGKDMAGSIVVRAAKK